MDKMQIKNNILSVPFAAGTENIMVWADGVLAAQMYDAWLTNTKPYSLNGNLCTVENNVFKVTFKNHFLINKIKLQIDTFVGAARTSTEFINLQPEVFIRCLFGNDDIDYGLINTIFLPVISREDPKFGEKQLARYQGWRIIGDGTDIAFPFSHVSTMTDKEILEKYLLPIKDIWSLDWVDETGFRLTKQDLPQMQRLTNLARSINLKTAWTTNPGVSGTQWYEIGDYLSLGRDTIDWRAMQPQKGWDCPSVDQIYRAQRQATKDKSNFLMNVSGCGRSAVPAYRILADIGFAVTLGAIGVKVYHLDTPAWKAQQQADPDNAQYGIIPGSPRWKAMMTAFKVIDEYTNLILNPYRSHTETANWSVLQAPRFKLAVNRLESPQVAPWRTDCTVSERGQSNSRLVQPGGWAISLD